MFALAAELVCGEMPDPFRRESEQQGQRACGADVDGKGPCLSGIVKVVQLQLMAHLSRWWAQRGLTADRLTASVLAKFLTARRDAGYRMWLSPKALRPL